jgi:hypothetical protein
MSEAATNSDQQLSRAEQEARELEAWCNGVRGAADGGIPYPPVATRYGNGGEDE